MPEFFADLEYDDNGRLIITREHSELNSDAVGQKALRAVKEGIVVSTGGKEISVKARTVCLHSDTPNVIEIAHCVHTALSEYL